MKPTPGTLTCGHLDGDECVEAELDIALYLQGGRSLEEVPAHLFLHLLRCPVCLQAALACAGCLADTKELLRRLRRERDALGRHWPESIAQRRAH